MAEAITVDRLSKALRKRLDAVRKPVAALAREYGIARDKLKDLAPKVIGIFNSIKGEFPEQSFTLADYARIFDPSVPTHPRATANNNEPGYQANRTYNALDYMQRSMRPARAGRQGKKDPATDSLGRMLATILQIVRDPAPIWEAVKREFQLGDRSLTRLQRNVANTKPLIDLSGVMKPVNIPAAAVVHMEPITREEPAKATGQTEKMRGVLEHIRGKGRRVKPAA